MSLLKDDIVVKKFCFSNVKNSGVEGKLGSSYICGGNQTNISCEEANIPAPHYELRPGGIVIIFDKFKTVSSGDVLENVLENILKRVLENNSSNITDRQRLIVKIQIETSVAANTNVLENVLDNVVGNVVGNVVDVVENVVETSASLSEYLNANERTVQRDIAKLQALGIIRHDGSDKGGKWVVIAT